MTAAAERWAIVGGGMLGLTLAHRLAQRGRRVTVIEGSPSIGGLAGAWQLDGVVWDRHYHVTLLSDSHLRRLLDELGLESSMRWVETRTGCYTDGELHSVSNSIEFLRFPPLALVDKLRLGATIAYGSKVRDWRRLEQVPVERWLRRWSGERTFERFWRPLLLAKLGESYREASAAFLWATIQRLYAARRTGLKKEMFGYVPGGYARILARFADVLAGEGVELRLGSPVAAVERVPGGVAVRGADGSVGTYDRVVVTANASIAARLVPGLTDEERRRLGAVKYQGIVCASLLLEQPLSPYYLTYITDAAPFTAVVEMSALVDRAAFGGRSLVYLPRYCRADDGLMAAGDDEVRERFLGALEAMYPAFRRQALVDFRVSRVREVFAVPTLGYSAHVPGFDTSVPGVHLVTSAQIVNGTLNVNETVQLAERAADVLAPAVHAATVARPAPVSAVVAKVAGTPPGAPRAKPPAALSLDLDNLWSYLKTHGDAGWQSFPSFLDIVVPRVLRYFDERALAATWFVVGRDAAAPENSDVLAAVAAAGHEIGNHSFLHEPWLHRYGPARLDEELARAEDAISGATGCVTTGFRAPGFSLSADVLHVLHRRGYRYDASTLPTFTGPLARRWYLRTAALTPEQRAERSALYGPLREGTRPLKPYRFDVGGAGLVEVPTTTMPAARTPIHMTYLLYLSEVSPAAARAYFSTALRLCRWTGVPPSVLLHSHDFLDAGDVPELAFFPGLGLPAEVKLQRVGEYLDRLREEFDVVPVGRYVDAVAASSRLPLVEPRFFHRTDCAPPAAQEPAAVRGEEAT